MWMVRIFLATRCGWLRASDGRTAFKLGGPECCPTGEFSSNFLAGTVDRARCHWVKDKLIWNGSNCWWLFARWYCFLMCRTPTDVEKYRTIKETADMLVIKIVMNKASIFHFDKPKNARRIHPKWPRLALSAPQGQILRFIIEQKSYLLVMNLRKIYF